MYQDMIQSHEEQTNCVDTKNLGYMNPKIMSRSNEQKSVEAHSMLVIGAGLMRTGTSSMKDALQMIYKKSCYHMSDVFFIHGQVHIKKWLNAFKHIEAGHFDPEFFRSVYKDYSSAVDYPTCVFYKEIMATYPEAKVILTERDADSWVSSCRATTLRKEMLQPTTLGERLVCWLKGISDLPKLHHRMFARTLGSNLAEMSDVDFRNAYLRWNAEVRATVPPHRLLVFNVQDGWEPLCHFLNVPNPPSYIPFPHQNNKDAMKKKLDKHFRLVYITDFIILILFIVMIFTFFGFFLLKLYPHFLP